MRSIFKTILLGAVAGYAISAFALPIKPALAAPSYGIAIHGDLKYSPDFKNFAYINPDAPKGGTLRLASTGTFDSLNPFILKGQPASGLNAMGQGIFYESLMTQSDDEPFSMYGLVAEKIDVSNDRKTVTFILNQKAKWQDGTQITSDDVKWTFETLMSAGNPFFKAYLGDVDRAETDGPAKVTFHIKNPDNRELPLILAQMVVLPKQYWTSAGRDFSQGNLTSLPMGSGPYKIGTIKAGASIEYIRDPNWWGKDLPVNRGRYNFDRITFDFYRDENVSLESFFAGNYDVRSENVAKLWATAYNAPPVKDGRIIKAEIPHAQPTGMQGFIFNTRRPIFADIRVREALSYAFDFEWSNKQLASSAYTRTDSYFENSDLASSALPQGKELDILEKFRGKIPDSVFTSAFAPPKTDGSGNLRDNLKKAAELLDQAGFKLGKDGIRVNDKGLRLTIDYIDANPALERWITPFIQNLRKIGVEMRLRTIDPAQYQNRMNNFDYDMTTMVIPQSDSPGNEQVDFWSSAKADIKGSRNYMGVKDPVVDELVKMVINAPTRADLVARTHALDRVLLAGHYIIPGWHYAKWRVASWKGFHHPDAKGIKSLGIIDDWWMDPAQAPKKESK